MQYKMDLELAKQIVAVIVDDYRRWGKHASIEGTYSTHEVLEALCILEESNSAGNAEKDAEITKLKRQLAAANARETRLKQRLQDARETR